MNTENLIGVVDSLKDLKEEGDTSKALKEKIDRVIVLLNGDSELAMDKALIALEELNSSELPSYHRTRVWDIISLLETVKTQ